MTLSPGLLVANSHNPASPSASSTSPTRASTRTWWLAAALAVLAWAGMAALQPAHARDVVWSIGLQTPGAVVHVANAPQPMVVVRPPVYAVAPPVVVYQPQYRPQYQPHYYPAPSPRHHGAHGHRDHWKEQHGRWQGGRGHGQPHYQPPYQAQQRGWDHHR